MIRKNLLLLLKNKKFILFCLLLFFINGVITYKSIKDQTIPVQNYSDMMSWLKQTNAPDEACMTYQKDLFSLSLEDYKFNNTFYQEYLLVQDVRTYVDGIYHYQASLNSIINNMDSQMFFYDLEDSTKGTHLLKTKEIYEGLHNVQPVMGNYYALTSFFKLDITDGIIMFLILAACTMLVIEERERGMYSLIKVTKRGGASFFLSKVASLILVTSISSVLFLVERLLITMNLYKCDTWNVPIQSVPDYLLSPFDISISHYMILFFITKVIIFATITIGLLFLCNLPFSSFVIYLVTGFVVAFNVILYQGIDLSSKYVPFKYMNFPALLDIKYMTSQLYFVDVGNHYIRVTPLHLLLLFLFFIGFLILGLWLYLNYKKSFQLKSIRWRRSAFYGYHASINEGKRLMLQRGGLALILILLLAGWYSNDFTKDQDENHIFFKNYVLKLNTMEQGEAKLWLSNRLDELQYMENQKIELGEAYASGTLTEEAYNNALNGIDRQLLLKPIVLQLMDQSLRIDRLKADRNITSNYTFDPLFDYLFGDKGAANRYMNGILLALISACLILPIFSHDRQYRIDKVLWVTKKGANNLLKNRCITLCIAEVVMLCMIQVLQFIALNHKFGFIGFDSKVQSLTYFENFPFPLSITTFLVLLTILKVFGILFITIVLISISMVLNDAIFSLLVGTLVLEFPIIISMLGFVTTKEYGLTPLIVPDVLFTNPNIGIYVNLFIIIFITIIFFLKSVQVWKKA